MSLITTTIEPIRLRISNFMDSMSMSEEIRGVRQRKKNTDPTCCPVCRCTIRDTEMEQHLNLEIDRLNKLSVNNRNRKSTNGLPIPMESAVSSPSQSAAACTSSSTDVNSSPSTSSGSDRRPVDSPKQCWTTYQRIKNNRQSRLKVKSRKRKADDPICPICNKQTSEDISVHVDKCLQRSENGTELSPRVGDDESDSSIDVENESYEEYEWAGQTRIRASTLLDGGFAAAGIGTIICNVSNTIDEDEDLNVDGDDTQMFGAAQYSESDIIVPSTGDKKEENANVYLRKLVTGQETVNISREQTNFGDNQHPSNMNDNNVTNGNPNRNSDKQIIESLKERIRDYEVQVKSKCKCLICMDEFRIPVVSICCWHVHCEECWLRSLGARKLCPQCNMITSPVDLRRIYM